MKVYSDQRFKAQLKRFQVCQCLYKPYHVLYTCTLRYSIADVKEQLSHLQMNKKLSKSLLKNKSSIRLVYKMGKCSHVFEETN